MNIMSDPKHLVVVGNGMAGMACVDQILKRINLDGPVTHS